MCVWEFIVIWWPVDKLQHRKFILNLNCDKNVHKIDPEPKFIIKMSSCKYKNYTVDMKQSHNHLIYKIWFFYADKMTSVYEFCDLPNSAHAICIWYFILKCFIMRPYCSKLVSPIISRQYQHCMCRHHQHWPQGLLKEGRWPMQELANFMGLDSS